MPKIALAFPLAMLPPGANSLFTAVVQGKDRLQDHLVLFGHRAEWPITHPALNCEVGVICYEFHCAVLRISAATAAHQKGECLTSGKMMTLAPGAGSNGNPGRLPCGVSVVIMTSFSVVESQGSGDSQSRN